MRYVSCEEILIERRVNEIVRTVFAFFEEERQVRVKRRISGELSRSLMFFECVGSKFIHPGVEIVFREILSFALLRMFRQYETGDSFHELHPRFHADFRFALDQACESKGERI